MRNAFSIFVKAVLWGLFFLLGKTIGFRRLLGVIAETSEKQGNFATYHQRPKFAVSVKTWSDKVRKRKKHAILIQGPILHDDNFTLETVMIYQKHFEYTDIILSTWDDESSVRIKRFEDLGVIVLLNRKPAYSGVSNINFQIVSSCNGVYKAREMGAEYLLKTRTDQRIYAPNSIDYLYNMTEVFPVHGNWPAQKKRIVGCSLNTFKYRMYGLSDMLIYGHIDDMERYWDVRLDGRVLEELKSSNGGDSLRSFALMRLCEVYLATEFLIRVGRELKWTLHDSWNAFADHFCIVDKQSLDLFWPKYNRQEYRWLTYGNDFRMQELSFQEWLLLYAGLEEKEVPDILLDKTKPETRS